MKAIITECYLSDCIRKMVNNSKAYLAIGLQDQEYIMTLETLKNISGTDIYNWERFVKGVYDVLSQYKITHIMVEYKRERE
jgi:hypothetical protein